MVGVLGGLRVVFFSVGGGLVLHNLLPEVIFFFKAQHDHRF